MNFYGKKCYLLVKKSYFIAIDNFVTKNCNDKARTIFKELKTPPRKDIDEKWFIELIHNNEDYLLDNVVKLASVSSSTSIDDEGYMIYLIHNVHICWIEKYVFLLEKDYNCICLFLYHCHF